MDITYRYDTQLLIDGKNLDEDAIDDYFTEHFDGDCLLVVGDEETIKIHYHTDEPWKVCAIKKPPLFCCNHRYMVYDSA